MASLVAYGSSDESENSDEETTEEQADTLKSQTIGDVGSHETITAPEPAETALPISDEEDEIISSNTEISRGTTTGFLLNLVKLNKITKKENCLIKFFSHLLILLPAIKCSTYFC